MSAWFAKQRHDWIVEAVQIFGFINRVHIERKFGISTPQASADIKHVMEHCPRLMEYDTTKKSYVLTSTAERSLNDVPTDLRH